MTKGSLTAALSHAPSPQGEGCLLRPSEIHHARLPNSFVLRPLQWICRYGSTGDPDHRHLQEHRHPCLCAEQAFLPVSPQQAKSPLGAQAASPCSAYAAERKARFLPGSGLAFCSIRRRISAHLFSSSAIWKASSATPTPEIGVVSCNSASHLSKATLLLGIMQSFVFTVWS